MATEESDALEHVVRGLLRSLAVAADRGELRGAALEGAEALALAVLDDAAAYMPTSDSRARCVLHDSATRLSPATRSGARAGMPLAGESTSASRTKQPAIIRVPAVSDREAS